ncbi:MAG: AmmeMemoRadiSam system protein B, partial [Deltaproteobacteria bacterium]|nr:AmmeMemoRadiSam system protein B [Deltaproteobacteria bacterium]
RKHFETPLGTFPPATETIDRIAAAYGTDRAFGEEILHRSEHSLELQLPLLAHRYAGALPEIVPILVGSFHHHLETRTSPRAGGEIDDFIGILASTLRELRDAGQQVLLYGGVDLAHVGKFFGDTERMSDTQLPSIEYRDRQLLEAIFSGDGEALFEHMAEDTDRRRICGFPSIYTMLHALADAGQPVRGELLEYHQAVDPTSDCTVTFATAYWSPSAVR